MAGIAPSTLTQNAKRRKPSVGVLIESTLFRVGLKGGLKGHHSF